MNWKSNFLLLGVLLVFFDNARADDALEESLGGVYRVYDEKSSGSGFAISVVEDKKERVFLLTAAHVLSQMPGVECKIAIRAREADGSYTRQEVKIPLRAAGKTLWKKHATMDVAVLPIPEPEKVGLATIPFARIAGEKEFKEKKVRVGQETWTPGYPAKAEANSAGWPVLRKGIIASHPLVPIKSYKTFFISSNTYGGDSGAPVLVQSNKEYWVAGMVLGMVRETHRVTLPYEEKVTHMPLGIGIAVQGEFLRETVTSILGDKP